MYPSRLHPLALWAGDRTATPAELETLSVLAGKFIAGLPRPLNRTGKVLATACDSDSFTDTHGPLPAGHAVLILTIDDHPERADLKPFYFFSFRVDVMTPASKQLDRFSMARLTPMDDGRVVV